MKISYNWLKEYIEKLPKPEKLAELLSVHSFEVKSVEKLNDDYMLDIDILPNRAHDCLSYIGIARECAAVVNSKLNPSADGQNSKLTESKNLKTRDFIKVEVQDRDACFRYTARVITDIKIESSPTWMQKRLIAMGQKPINNVVDATNYVMFETGQPLHVFDYEKLEGKKIIIRRARKGEKITTLDNEIYELNEDVLIIADAKNPLALAGVKGGKRAEVTDKTKTIVLESANFDIKVVRSTCRETGIKTESSIRFEYGLDPNLTEEAINGVARLIEGKITKGIVDIYSKKVLPLRVRLNLNKVEGILGIRVSKQQVIKYLKSLGFTIDNSLRVIIPTIRRDIEIEEDLIEEIARLIGYNNIVTSHPFGLLGMARLNDELIVINKVKTIFESAGFNEVYNVSFVSEADIKKFDVNIFELGKTYRQKNKKNEEERMLAGLIARCPGKMRGENFYEAKGVIDNLLNKLGISDIWYDDFQATPEWTDDIFWQRTETAEIKVGDEEIGFIGEINATILNKLNIKAEVSAFSLNFEKLLKLAEEELIYRPPSPYPAAVRDLAVLVNLKDRVADIQNIIEQIGGELVFDVDLFDMYEGEEIPGGKKNLAFHIIYQSYEKTLKDQEVDRIHRRIIRGLEENKNWEVRK
jgi:phenylalanyl-tRNA synthetase beta chain